MPRRHDGEGERRLIAQFSRWAGGSVPADYVQYAFEYKRALGDDRPTLWTHELVHDFFLGYLPAKVVLEGDEPREAADTICRFFEFLDATERLDEGSDPAADLVAHVADDLPAFKELMADPAVGGPAKRILMAMLGDGVDVEDEDAVSAWVDAFNARPPDERDAALHPALDLDAAEPGIELPARPRVDPVLARQAAAAAEILSKMQLLAEFMGEGRRLTDRGNLRLADARELVDLLETGDVVDHAIGDRVFRTRSAADLLWLDLIVWWAREVGAVKVRSNRMSANKTWLRRAAKDPLEVMGDVATTVVETGPVMMVHGDRTYLEVDALLDASTASLLALFYESDCPLEDLVGRLTTMLPALIPLPDWYGHTDADGETHLEWLARRRCQTMVRVMEMTGMVTWRGGSRVEDDYGFERWHGGVVSITDFGRWMVQGYLAEAGLVSAPVTGGQDPAA